MPNILIVDDSAVERQRTGRLLAKYPDVEITYAIDGVDALAKMDECQPDAVLTDLIMPNMDGLELVEQIRQRHPTIPAVLMTSRGTEELAVKALQRGAASYVPKGSPAREVWETLRHVLDVADQQRCQSRLMQYMSYTKFQFELDNDRALVAPLIGYLQQHMLQFGIVQEADQMRVAVAIDEALMNALYHGNLELPSHLREMDNEAYQALVRERASQVPYQGRKVRVQADLSPDRAIIEITDDGPGFDPQQLPDPTDPANLEKTSGRGVLLMRTFMDSVEYNAKGNGVRLTKTRKG